MTGQRQLRPFVLTETQREHLPRLVYAELARHRGHRQAVTGRELAATLGHRDDRAIRLAIRELIREGIPVAASVTEPMGFYLCSTRDEAVRYMTTLQARADEALARLRDFQEAVAKSFDIPQQGELL